jgi:hypothetical protein
MKRRHKKRLTFLAIFFIFYFPLLFAVLHYYFLQEADFLAPQGFEAPDLIDVPAGSENDMEAFGPGAHSHSFFLDSNILDRLSVTSFRIADLGLTTSILRC